MYPDDEAPSTGFTRGNGGAGVDKILHVRIVRPLCEGKAGQRWNGVDSTGYTFWRPRPRAAGGWHAPVFLLAPNSFNLKLGRVLR